MTANAMVYGDINQRTAAYAAAEALAHAEPILCLSKFGMTKAIPKNKANVIKFRRAVPFTAATAPLTEGVTPASQKFNYEDVTFTLRQYGRPIEITDVVMDLSEDPVLKDAMKLAGEQAALTMETLLFGAMKAGTNLFRANGSARTDINTTVTLNLQHAVTRALRAQKAMMITSMLDGSPNYGTRAIEAGYIAFGHTDLEHDIRAIPGFVPCAEYGSRKAISQYELGSVESVRYILSPELEPFEDGGGTKAGSGTTMISTAGTSADVYPLLYVGRDSYGLTPLKGENALTPMVVNPKPSAADPMAQRGFVSWKSYWAGGIFNENWMARAEVAATNL